MATHYQLYYGLDPEKPYVSGFWADSFLPVDNAGIAGFDFSSPTVNDLTTCNQVLSAIAQTMYREWWGLGVRVFSGVTRYYPTSPDDDPVIDEPQLELLSLVGSGVIGGGPAARVAPYKCKVVSSQRASIFAFGLLRQSTASFSNGAAFSEGFAPQTTKLGNALNNIDRVAPSGSPAVARTFVPLGPFSDRLYHGVRRG
jgi:hypothetical protein